MSSILPHHTLLLLEDEPRVACALSHLITMIGPSIVQTSSVELAQAAFQDDQSIRWVLADYGMNGELTGLDFLAWAKEERSEVKRILISGLDIHDIHDEIEAICDDFIPKPFGVEELRAVLLP